MEYTSAHPQTSAAGAPQAPSWMPDAEVQVDPLPARRPKRRRLVAIVVCFLAALLSLAVVVGEWGFQTVETDAMLDQIERSEAAMVTAMETVSSVLEEEGSYDGGLSQDAADRLSAAAGEAKAEVFAASDALKSLSVQSWHYDIEDARQAYLEHSAVWLAFLSRAQLEPASWLVEDPAIATTWDAFAGELLEAVPSPSLGTLEDRARAIIGEDAGTDDGGDTIRA